MSSVYVAEHHVTRQQVALKVLDHARLTGAESDDDEALERFQREACIAADVGHDGIVQVLDAGHDHEWRCLFIAMELLQGRSLREHLLSSGQRQDTTLGYLQQLLEPLAAAHRKGYVHRDLKPDNVFITTSVDGHESVKLLDFGIVRHPSLTALTQVGTALGTPWYMSPEHAMSPSTTTPAADVWSVGVMLYEAISGIKPFDGDTAHAVIVHLCTRPHRPLQALAPDVSPDLAKLVDRCLAKDPAARFKDASELAEGLDLVLRLDSLPPISRLPSIRVVPPPSVWPEPVQSPMIRRSPSKFSRMLGPLLCGFGTLATWIGVVLLGLWNARGQAPIEIAGLAVMVMIASTFAVLGWRRGHGEDDTVSVLPTPARVKKSLPPPSLSPVENLSEVTPTLGDADAPVSILLFGDYTCVRTQRVQRVLDDVIARYDGYVRLQWKHCPQVGSSDGQLAAEAAREVFMQLGNLGFWKFHRLLLSHRGTLRRHRLEQYAKQVEVDGSKLQRVLERRVHRSAIRAEYELGLSLGVSTTPTLFINGLLVRVAPSAESLAALVDAELGTLGLAHTEAAMHERTTEVRPAAAPTHVAFRYILVSYRGARPSLAGVVRSQVQASERAQRILDRVRTAGVEFEALVARLSDDPNAVRDGGNAGVVARADVDAALADVVFDLRIGEVGPIVETTAGYHIVQRYA